MDKEGIKLLQWMQIRLFINRTRYVLSLWMVRLLLCLYVFLATFLLIPLVQSFGSLAYSFHISLASRQFFVFIILFMGAISTVFLAFPGMILKTYEQDILLVIPASAQTVIRSRLLTNLYLLSIASLGISLFALFIEYIAAGANILLRLPFAFVSVFLLMIGCAGAAWLLNGLMKKYREVDLAVNVFVGLSVIISLILFFWAMAYNPYVIGWFLDSSLVRAFLVVPSICMDVIIFGGFSLDTLAQLLILAGIAGLFAGLAYKFDYALYEGEISPYHASMGRGGERESPPSPAWVRRIEKLVRIRYYDRGEGAKAVFGCAYSTGFGVNFSIGLVLGFLVVLFAFLFSGGTRSWVQFQLIFVVPMFMFFSLLMGSMAGQSTQSVRRDILRMIPVEGRRKLVALILPGLLQIGACYLIALVAAIAITPVYWPLFAFEVFMVSPMMLISGYVTGVCIQAVPSLAELSTMSEGTVFPLAAQRRAFPNQTFMIIPMLWMFCIFAFMFILFLQPAIVITGVFLMGSLMPILAYYMFEKSAEELDVLRPKGRKDGTIIGTRLSH